MGKSELITFSGVFSKDDVAVRLTSIFHASIVLDLQYNILAVHHTILESLRYKDLIGKHVGSLASGHEFTLRLKLLLSQGAFQNEPVILCDAEDRSVRFTLSGFNLGLISDINEVIVLQAVAVTPMPETSASLDHFIYRAAHDLRGPLATIKGLVNLLEIKPLRGESAEIVRLLHFQADKLDQRLFELSYLSGVTGESKKGDVCTTLADIETALRNVIVRNVFVDAIDFSFNAPDRGINGFNENAVYMLSANILQFILALPVTNIPAKISYTFETRRTSLQMKIAFNGFHIDGHSQNGMEQQNFLYTDLVTYPQLLNYFTARKVAAEMEATFTIDFGTSNIVTIEIPSQKC